MCTWVGENNWWCPHVHLVPRIVRHAQNTKANGTLIIPQWLSSPFWPLLFPNGFAPAEFVEGVIELPNCDTLFLPGQSGTNLFKGLPNTPVLALRLVFNDPSSETVYLVHYHIGFSLQCWCVYPCVLMVAAYSAGVYINMY